MIFLFIFTLLLFSPFIVANNLTLLDPCGKDDLACLQSSYISFMNFAVNGLGEPFHTQPLDPLTVADWSVPACCEIPPKGNVTFKNTVIEGLKNSRLDGFQLDVEKKLLIVNLTATFKFNSQMVLEYGDKIYNGSLEIKDAEIKGMIQYEFLIFKDDKGEEHFDLNTKKIVCEALNIPVATPNPEFKEALDHDTEFMEMVKKNGEKFEELQRNHGCTVTNLALPKLIETWRTAARVLPINMFFTSLN